MLLAGSAARALRKADTALDRGDSFLRSQDPEKAKRSYGKAVKFAAEAQSLGQGHSSILNEAKRIERVATQRIGSFDNALASVEATEKEFRVFGFAGQAIVHDLRNEPDEVAIKLSEIWGDIELLELGLRTDVERIARERGLTPPGR